MESNPFEVTKAVDFTDAQIAETFVPWPTGSVANPKSPMTQFLVGGKGGGRTHLMRHLSYSLQRERGSSVLQQIMADGYVGVYFRCSGLSGSRFSGRGLSKEVWQGVFSYYMDLWVTEQLLHVLADIQSRDACWDKHAEQIFSGAVSQVIEGSTLSNSVPVTDIPGMLALVAKLRRSVDVQVNNAAVKGEIQVEITSNPGEMIFGVARAVSQSLTGLENVVITFLIDEYENLNIDQQMYVNTLIREKQLPVTFLVGSRAWGVRTQLTLSADEENKRGSEYEWIELEEAYRARNAAYSNFCVSLVKGRLNLENQNWDEARLQKAFEKWDAEALAHRPLLSILKKYSPEERPHLARLVNSVTKATGNSELAHEFSAEISCANSPLVEKLSILRFYQDWSRARKLDSTTLAGAIRLRRDLLSGRSSKESEEYLKRWRSDMIAQVHAEASEALPYYGFEQFIEMSTYLPRSFLVVLKHVYRRDSFSGGRPFQAGQAISIDVQTKAVLDAANWYSVDSLPVGPMGDQCEIAIRRLGTFMNRYRYSDKPAEPGAVAFSTDLHNVSRSARDCLEAATTHGLLLEVPGGRIARDSGSRHKKYQLHPMIAPLYGLPTRRKGTIAFKSDEIDAFFAVGSTEENYSTIVEKRLASLIAPFGAYSHTMEALFDLD
ncbi:hypothetical protein ASF98_19170 [Arthrobacter sp. Leaf337]|uniref:ORC-CDC6 family AAA ATPase n=1 Tax=Arthrobacter sp. Leaf337 TaxID=1736342 RepID=UPI0006F481D4|nr:hypothetical protein [Arthrobacter sp. Leaf337]KQR80073.1 hypothetical protein ASF98_19170 [Arthrobacter sp. Leaf337]